MDPRTVFPEQFAWKEWWRPLREGRPWYYHTPRQMAAPPSHTVDYNTLDKGVAGLIGKLHGYGVPTWPTCEGHWFEPQPAREMFEQIQRDEHAIQTRGLQMEHTETGQRVVYYNPTWHTKWNGWHSFYHDVSRGNGLGLVAFSPPEGSSLWRWSPNVRYVTARKEAIGPHQAIVVR
ncbi:hypothetical protein K0U83_16315, partial [bacterium]|nr:hypothetical protein [bacterium]